MTTQIIIEIVLAILTVAGILLSYFLYIRGELIKKAVEAIDSAEQPDKSGTEKLNQAIEHAYSVVPSILKPFFTRAVVEKLIQKAFDAIQSFAKKQQRKKE